MAPSVVFRVTVRRNSSRVALTNGSTFFFSMVTSSLGGGMDEIMRYADVAMYSAKRSGRGQHRAFDAAMLG